MIRGDILFFYMTKSARTRITKLSGEAKLVYESSGDTSIGWRLLSGITRMLAKKGEQPTEKVRLTMLKTATNLLNTEKAEQLETVRLLEHAANQAERYAGTIFGRAEVAGAAKFIENEIGGSRRFQGNIFAPLSKVHIFKYPLPIEEFADHVQIRQGATTSLFGESFEAIKRLLEQRNTLPDYLRNARPAGRNFSEAGPDTWPEISCRKDARFVDESELREFLLNYLLDELKDEGTSILKECRCSRKRSVQSLPKPGIADYFVKIHDFWIPLEAKLNTLAERNLVQQLRKYIQIDTFIPKLAPHKGEHFEALRQSLCLVADQHGIYLTSDGEFRNCSPGQPIWKREELDHSISRAIRDRIREELDE